MVFFITLNGFGQASEYLKAYNNKGNADTTRLLALYDLIWEKVYADTDSAEVLTKLGLNSELTAKNPRLKSKFFNAYGAISQIKGNFSEALNYYQQGLKNSEKYNDLRTQASMLGNIGGIYIKVAQNDQALVFLKKCLSVLKMLKDESNQASVYNNLSIVYQTRGDLDMALEYSKKSIEYYTNLNDKTGLVYSHNNMANLYEKRNMLKEALIEYKIALKNAEETENYIEIGRTNSEIGNILLLQKKDQEAIAYLKKAEKIAKEAEDLDTQSDIANHFYSYYLDQKKYKEALESFTLHKKLIDDIDRLGKQEEISKLQFEYDYQKKAEADSIKMAGERAINIEKLERKNAQIAKAKIQLIAIIVVVALLVIVSLIIYNRFRLTQKQKVIIEEKNKQTEEQKLIIEEKQKEIVDSINYAKRIQDSLFDNFESVKRFFSDAFVLNKPKDIVSGDFYWLSKKINDDIKHAGNQSVVTELFYIAICDSTGHGVPGGFMSLLNMAYLSEAINEKNIYEPNRIFDYVRERLINTISKNDQKDGFDGVLMRFEKRMYFENKQQTKTEFGLTYAAAYNAPVIIKNNTLIELDCDKMPVGYGERTENFKLYAIDLEKDDLIYVYTDGYADQFGGPRGKKFKYKQLNELLLSMSSLDLETQSQELTKQFNDWKGNIEQVDDVCIVGVRI